MESVLGIFHWRVETLFVKSRRKLKEVTQMVQTCHAHVFQTLPRLLMLRFVKICLSVKQVVCFGAVSTVKCSPKSFRKMWQVGNWRAWMSVKGSGMRELRGFSCWGAAQLVLCLRELLPVMLL